MRASPGKESIGLTWDAAGHCHGIHLRTARDGCVVVGCWQATGDAGEDISLLLPRGVTELGVTENGTLIAGGIGTGTGCLDLTVPRLTGSDLLSLLGFELRKHSPLPLENIVWGYRHLPNGNKESSLQSVRLFYVRENYWRQWIDNISGIRHGIDNIVPPAAALDPVLSGRGVLLRPSSEHSGYIWDAADCSFRQPLAHDSGMTSAPELFGACPRPLELPGLDLGALGQRPEDEQCGFAPALILALYGLSKTAREDRKTGLPLPPALRPQRHRTSIRLAACLAIYIVAVATFAAGRHYVKARQTLLALNQELHQTESMIEKLSATRDPGEFVKSLHEDLDSQQLSRPHLSAALLELTRLLGSEYWVSNLNWNDGKIDMEIRTTVDDLGFIGSLEDSPLLVDVVPTRKVVDHQNNLIITVQCHVANLVNAGADRDSSSGSGTTAAMNIPGDGQGEE